MSVLALSEAGAISLVTAFLSAVAIVIVAFIGRGNRIGRAEAREHTAEIKEAVQAENGHATLGTGLAAVEDRLIENRAILDTVEAKLDSHIQDTAPLVARAKAEWGTDGTEDGSR